MKLSKLMKVASLFFTVLIPPKHFRQSGKRPTKNSGKFQTPPSFRGFLVAKWCFYVFFTTQKERILLFGSKFFSKKSSPHFKGKNSQGWWFSMGMTRGQRLLYPQFYSEVVTSKRLMMLFVGVGEHGSEFSFDTYKSSVKRKCLSDLSDLSGGCTLGKTRQLTEDMRNLKRDV